MSRDIPVLIHGPFSPHVFTLQSVPITSFVGREADVQAATSLLADDGVRLLTLTGPGGVGKTRLAIRVAEVLAPSYGDGALFIPLSTVRDPALALSAIAYALGVHEGSDRSLIERISSALGDRHLLLVLDNFEQIAAAAPDVGDLVTVCRRITVVVTSRVPLRIFGEVEFAVQPLRLPDANLESVTELAENPSVSLFVQRAQAVRAGFSLQEGNALSVAEVCRRLDGLPLAIELAAARSKVLSPPALLARLTNGLEILIGGPQNQPARLRTMRAAIAWSVDLLSPGDRELFRQLAVFTGGFTLEAAEAVSRPAGSDHPEPTLSVLDALTSLVDCNLLRTQEERDGELRFSMLETVREFGLEQLQAGGDASAVRDRHAAYLLSLAEQAAPELFGGVRQTAWLDRLDREHDNFRAALAWTEQSGDVDTMQRLVGSLFWFWYVRGYVSEGRAWAKRALDLDAKLASPAVNRARVLLAAGTLAHFQDDDVDAERCLLQSIDLYRTAGDEAGRLFALAELGVVAEDSGHYAEAAKLYEEVLELHRASNVPLPAPYLVITLYAHLGVARWGLGNREQAIAMWEDAIERHRALDDRWGAANVTGYLAYAACEQGNYHRAARLQRESLTTFLEAQSMVDVVDGITKTATIAGCRGDYQLSARLFAAGEALDRAIGNRPAYPERVTFDRVREEVRRALPPALFEAAEAEGRALSISQAAQEALRSLAMFEEAAVAEPAAPAGDLTARETEVLRLLVQGQTDREIADALFISPRTAQGHVGRIFDKLGVNSRSAAVATALAAGLVPPPPLPDRPVR